MCAVRWFIDIPLCLSARRDSPRGCPFFCVKYRCAPPRRGRRPRRPAKKFTLHAERVIGRSLQVVGTIHESPEQGWIFEQTQRESAIP